MKTIYQPVIEMAKNYAKATGVSVRVFDNRVHEIYQEKSNWLSCHHCPYNEIGKNHVVSGCVKSQMLNISEGNRSEKSHVYSCQFGYIFWMSFIMIEGKSLASIVAGLPISQRKNTYHTFVPPKESHEVLFSLGNVEREKIEGLTQILTLSSQAISQSYTNDKEDGFKFQVKEPSIPYEPLVKAISWGDVKETQRQLAFIFNNFVDESEGHLHTLKNLSLNLVLYLKQVFEKRKAWNNLSLSVPLLAMFERVCQPKEIFEWLKEVIKGFYHKPVLNISQGKYSHLLEVALEYIHINFSKDIDLKTVASHLELSESYFSRIFKNELQIGFIEYLNALRINESKRLLKFTNKSLLEIAIDCGFADQSYFTKIFKKVEGDSPGRYRKAISIKEKERSLA